MPRLEPEEEVLWAARPHPAMLARPAASSLVVLAGCVAAFLEWSGAPGWFGLLLGAVLLLRAALLLRAVLRWRASLLAVTSLRVLHRAGLLRRSGREVPIARVEDVSYRQGVAGRVLGYGSLTLESAGAAEPAPFAYVRDPEEVQHQVHRAAERARREPRGERRGAGVVEQIERLEALWRRGVLSAAEFSAKKSELLERL